MLGNDVIIHAFQPLWLTIEGQGPLPDNPYEIDFTDSEDAPCNFFLLMSDNGKGKTTVLNLLSCLMRLLGEKEPKEYGLDNLDEGELRVQWDVRVNFTWQGKEHAIVLSLLAGAFGDDPALKPWGDSELTKFQTKSWHRVGFKRRAKGFLEPIGRGDDVVSAILSTLQNWRGESPSGFEENDFNLPTVLYFSAYRDIPSIMGAVRNISDPEHWGYQPAHAFAPHTSHWADSLDNLLVWLYWLDSDRENGRFKRAQDIINKRVFEGTSKFLKGIRKTPPEAIVQNGESEHRLDRLSSGEKNLVQLFLRIGAHMTRNTIILIDEPEVHLHPRWQHRLMRHMKEFLKDNPGCTIIAATHSLEMLEAFGFEAPEENLRKSGYLLERDMK